MQTIRLIALLLHLVVSTTLSQKRGGGASSRKVAEQIFNDMSADIPEGYEVPSFSGDELLDTIKSNASVFVKVCNIKRRYCRSNSV